MNMLKIGEREVMQNTDDTRLIREKLSDSSPVWDVEIDVTDGNGDVTRVIVVGCNDAVHGRQTYAALSQASHITIQSC
jgi:hypothetical protein